MTRIKVSKKSNLVSDVFVQQSGDLAALEILLNEDDIVIAAHSDSKLPSILVGKGSEPFTKITFLDFEGMKVWSAEISGRILRLCLAKFEPKPRPTKAKDNPAKKEEFPEGLSKWQPSSRMWVDPPSGWQFGFPKVWDKEKHEDFESWLVAEGYPEREIKRMGDYFHCRFWAAEK